jgi:hypothetical protein
MGRSLRFAVIVLAICTLFRAALAADIRLEVQTGHSSSVDAVALSPDGRSDRGGQYANQELASYAGPFRPPGSGLAAFLACVPRAAREG